VFLIELTMSVGLLLIRSATEQIFDVDNQNKARRDRKNRYDEMRERKMGINEKDLR
jgi:hypothetical protein